METANHPNLPILKFFAYAHLPAHLQPVSKLCAELAREMVEVHAKMHTDPITGKLALKEPAELTAGLRKLLEAKDCFVRASL